MADYGGGNGLSTDHFYSTVRSSKSSVNSRRLSRTARENGSASSYEEGRIVVDSVGSAFSTVTAEKLLVFIINMTYFCVLLLFIAIPMLVAIPGGFYEESGEFKFISIGFKQHSALASFIWGVSTTFIGFARLLSIVMYIKSPLSTIILSLLITVSVGAGIVTVRYDEVIDMHIAAAATWIATSLVFYAFVAAFNGIYSNTNGGSAGIKITWTLNVLSALLFLGFIIKFNLGGRNQTDFLVAGVCEYATAFLILFIDFQVAYSIHGRFLKNASLLTDIQWCACCASCCCCGSASGDDEDYDSDYGRHRGSGYHQDYYRRLHPEDRGQYV